VCEAEELDEHVHVQRLPHLGFDHTQVARNVTEDSRELPRRDAICTRLAWRNTIEQGINDEAHGEMEATRSSQRVLRDHLVEPTRVTLEQAVEIGIRLRIREVQGKLFGMEVLSIHQSNRQRTSDVMRVQREEEGRRSTPDAHRCKTESHGVLLRV
jgi:hypothetical protein